MLCRSNLSVMCMVSSRPCCVLIPKQMWRMCCQATPGGIATGSALLGDGRMEALCSL